MLILDKLWAGQLDPAGRRFHRDDAYFYAVEKMGEAKKCVQNLLTPEGRTLLEEYSDRIFQVAGCFEKDAFFTGFRTAGLLILDILCGADES